MATDEQRREYRAAMVEAFGVGRYSAATKGGEKMAKIPAWLLLILNFLLSDLFDQLLEWAKEILSSTAPTAVVSKADAREDAILKLRAQAEVNGLKVTRWQAGQAVEAAYAQAFPWKTKVPEA